MTGEDSHQLIDAIDALLPQTQCTRCGYAGCRPYAAAIAAGEADINQCPPGGDATIRALAARLGRAYRPLNPANGVESAPRVAVIDEARRAGARIAREGTETFWGGYSGVFVDPDGHPWEVAHNPHWTLAEDGSVVLPE